MLILPLSLSPLLQTPPISRSAHLTSDMVRSPGSLATFSVIAIISSTFQELGLRASKPYGKVARHFHYRTHQQDPNPSNLRDRRLTIFPNHAIRGHILDS